MKNKEDFERALGPADPAFVAAIHQTLHKLEKQEEEKPMRKFSASLVLVLSLLLLTAVAFAAVTQWGVLDFLGGYENGGEVLPEAAELVQSDVGQEGGQTESATFALREALMDGTDLYMVVAIQPNDPKTLLLGVDAMPSDPISMLLRDNEEDTTIMDYAYQNGYDTLMRTNIYDAVGELGQEGVVDSLDYRLEEDGTLVYIIYGSARTSEDTLPVELVCTVTPFVDITVDDSLDVELRKESRLSFTLEAKPQGETLVSTKPTVYTDCGVRVDSLTLTKSPMATYVEVIFTVIDEAQYALTDDGLWFEFLTEDGEVIQDSVIGGGEVGPLEGAPAGTYVQRISLTALSNLPERVVMRGYNCWEKNRYEAHLFELQ